MSTLDRSYHEAIERARREDYENRNHRAVQERLAREEPGRQATRRAEIESRMRASAALRNC